MIELPMEPHSKNRYEREDVDISQALYISSLDLPIFHHANMQVTTTVGQICLVSMTGNKELYM